MIWFVSALLCCTILTAAAGFPTAYAEEPSRWRFDMERPQSNMGRPRVLQGVAERRDIPEVCTVPTTGHEIPKQDCLAWFSFILLGSLARDGGEVPNPPLEPDQGSRQ